MAAEVNIKFLIFSLLFCNQRAQSVTKTCETPVNNKDNNQPYFLSGQPLSWADAGAYCINHNGVLVELFNQESRKNATAFLRNRTDELMWLGGRSEVLRNFTYLQTRQPVNYNSADPSNTTCLALRFSSDQGHKTPRYVSANCSVATEGFYICRKTGNNPQNIFISPQTRNWFDARNFCSNQFDDGYGDLFYLGEGETLFNFFSIHQPNDVKPNESYFIGIHRLRWYWKESGNSIVFAEWLNNQPSESGASCLAMRADGLVDDVACSKNLKAFCIRTIGKTQSRSRNKTCNDNTEQEEEDSNNVGQTEDEGSNVSLWIGVGVGAAVGFLVICTVALLCYKRKSLSCCSSGDSKSNPDQFYYLNNTLDSPKPSVYSQEPTKQPSTKSNEITHTYESIDHLTPEGSTNDAPPRPPDVAMRPPLTSQNGVARKDVYSQVLKNKNNLNLNNDVNDLKDPESDEDPDIIDNDIYHMH